MGGGDSSKYVSDFGRMQSASNGGNEGIPRGLRRPLQAFSGDERSSGALQCSESFDSALGLQARSVPAGRAQRKRWADKRNIYE